MSNKIETFRVWFQKTLPMSYDDTLTYAEMLYKLVNKLNEVVESQNNLSDDFMELYNSFLELKKWIEEWFDNLDVQEEVNNKLDKMVVDGTLAKIINEDLFSELDKKIEQKPFRFDTLTEAKVFNNFKIGDIFITAGLDSVGDRGQGTYIVRNGLIADGGRIVDIKNSLQAILISEINNFVYGIFDGEESTEKIQNFLKNSNVVFYGGNYHVNKQININKNLTIKAVGTVNIIADTASTEQDAVFNICVEDLNGNETILLSNSDIQAKTTTITKPSSIEVSENDIIRISNSQLYVADRGYYNRGELKKINHITSNTIYFETPTIEAYSNATVQLIKGLKFNIFGDRFNIICFSQNWDRGILAVGLADSELNNLSVSIENTQNYESISLCDSININFNNLQCYQLKPTSNGYDYGLSIASCENINVYDFIGYAGRHAISTGVRRTTKNTLNRFIKSINGIYSARDNYSCDMHGNTCNSHYDGYAQNGISFGGNNNKFSGRIDSPVNGYCIHIAENDGYSFDFSNCEMHMKSDYNPFISLPNNGLVNEGGLINVTNCKMFANPNGGKILIYLRQPNISASGERCNINLSGTSYYKGTLSNAVYQDSNSTTSAITPIGVINLSGLWPYNANNKGCENAILQINPDCTKI